MLRNGPGQEQLETTILTIDRTLSDDDMMMLCVCVCSKISSINKNFL